MTQKVQAPKEKIYKLDIIKIKNLCASKNTIKKVKRQSKKWENLKKNHTSDKGLVSRIYIKNSYNSIIKQINNN